MQGPRLFPAVLMALIILLKIGKYQHFQSNIPIHLIWCFGVLWSPESAFYVTLIWWPYYLWTKYIDCKTEQIIPTLFKAGLVLIGWLAALLGTFLIIYYASYGIMPSLGAFFYYQMHPPGGMPINYAGPIWFFLGIISLAGAALYQGLKNHPNEEETHFIFITLLLLFGTASYFLLGRSHSSNLINISPIILISLIATRNVFRTKLGIIPTSIVLLSFISYGEFKNLGSWSITRKFEFDHKHLLKSLIQL